MSPHLPVLYLQLHPGLPRLLCLPADEPGAEGRAVDSGLGGLPGALHHVAMLPVGLLRTQLGQPHRDQRYPQVGPIAFLPGPFPLPLLTVAPCDMFRFGSVLLQTKGCLHSQFHLDWTPCGVRWQVAWFPFHRGDVMGLKVL